MPTPFMLLGAIYLLVFGLIALSAGRGRDLGLRTLLAGALWPLDLLWPLLIAAVATLELCAALARRRFESATTKTEAVT